MALSAADRKWIQEIVDITAYERLINIENKKINLKGIDFIGSDEDLRNKFIRYVHGITDGSEYK